MMISDFQKIMNGSKELNFSNSKYDKTDKSIVIVVP
jgi:hypothetical protein